MSGSSIIFKILARKPNEEYIYLHEYLEGGDIIETIDDVPNARLQFLDKNKKLENLLTYTASFPLVVSVSSDSGAHYNRLYKGDVETIDLSMDDKGDRHVSFLVYGGTPFRYSIITPNQVAIGDCDIGQIMTGTPSASYTSAGSGSSYYGRTWSVAWNADSYGNYPNGLLYDTGYSMSGITDAVESISDVPLQIGYGSNQLLDSIRSFLEPYGLSFMIYDLSTPPLFSILPNSALGSWSNCDWFTASIGKNVSTFDRRINLAKRRDKIIAISSAQNTIFDIFGQGNYEELIQNDNIDSQETARSISKRMLSMTQIIPEGWDVSVLPTSNLKYGEAAWTANTLLGKSIVFADLDGTILNRNVIEITQQFTTDRWITNLRLETPADKIAKTLEEVKAEFDNISRSDLAGIIYLRGASFTSTAYNNLYSNVDIYPCAIGIGSSSDTTSEFLFNQSSSGYFTVSGDSHMKAPMVIVPLRGVVEEGEDPDFPLTQSAYANFSQKQGIGLIKEIVLFGNTNSDNSLLTLNEMFSWSRATDSSQLIQEDFLKKQLGTLSGTWPVSIEKITLVSEVPSTSIYSYKISDADIKFVSWSATTLSAGDTTWDNAFVPEAQQTLWLSKDNELTPYANKVLSLSATGTHQPQVVFEWKFPIDQPTAAPRFIHGIDLWLIGRGTWSGGTNDPLNIYIWISSTNEWNFFDTMTGGAGSCSLKQLTHNSQNEVDSNGKIRIMLANEHGHSSGTSSIVLRYGGIKIYARTRGADWWYDSGTSEFATVVEKCKWDWKTGKIITTLPAFTIGGMWLYGSFSDDGQTFYNRWTTSDPNTWVIAENMVEKYHMEATEAFADQFTFYYDVKEITPGRGKHIDYAFITDPGKDKTRQFDRVFAFLNSNEQKILWDNEFLYVSYSTKQRMSLDAPQTFDTSILQFRYKSGTNGSRSDLWINVESAPVYGTKLNIEYKAVGSPDDPLGGGVMGRCILHPSLDSDSAIREGVDKNSYKELNIQYDIYGVKTPSHTASIDTTSEDYTYISTKHGDTGYVSAMGSARDTRALRYQWI